MAYYNPELLLQLIGNNKLMQDALQNLQEAMAVYKKSMKEEAVRQGRNLTLIEDEDDDDDDDYPTAFGGFSGRRR